ncbi:hypothetical protein BDC45DRAFT_571999 [Circinella umbellata]|nr:hypothetical protein BDC45DRAFT_571999 [Circinella umbellata]
MHLPSLITKITAGKKNKLQAIFITLDQDKFWYPQVTLKEADPKGLFVEERVVQFALNCNYCHPNQQLILDLGDSNWDEVFAKEEKKEIEDAGSRDAYDFLRALSIDPEEESMLAWLSATHVVALGKEKSSAANLTATNNKRRISAVDPVENKKMGLKTDTVYIGDGNVELGCFGNRKGKRPNQRIQRWIGQDAHCNESTVTTIAVEAVRFNIIAVLTASLWMVSLVKTCRLLTGYNIIGNKISLIDMNIPKGYVMRIRRSKQVGYSDSKDNCSQQEIPLEGNEDVGLAIPPRIYISPSSSSETSTSIGSSNKRQNTGNSNNSDV